MGLKVVPIPREDYDALASVLAENNLLAGDLTGENKKFFAFVDEDGWRVGVGGLEIYGDVGVLRSFCTVGCHRGQGLGGSMVEELVACARRAGVKTLYLFTNDASGFFSKFGFTPCERQDAPDTLRNSAQFMTQCTAADFMMREL